MIAEMTQLASKKLAEARARASVNIQRWQLAVSAADRAQKQANHRIVLLPEHTHGLSTAAERITRADYLMVLKIDRQAIAAHRNILAFANKVLAEADARTLQAAEEAKLGLHGIVLPPKPDNTAITGTGILGGFGGFVAGVFLLYFVQHLSFFPCLLFIIPFVTAAIGAVVTQFVVWVVVCKSIDSRAHARAATKTAAAASDHRRIQAARALLMKATE